MNIKEMYDMIKDYCSETSTCGNCKLYSKTSKDCNCYTYFCPILSSVELTDEEIIKKYNTIFDDDRTKTSHTKEMVNHPSHYQGNKFEVIDIIEDYNLDFCLGNAVKYILRAGKKDDIIQDINKAIWYLERFKESN